MREHADARSPTIPIVAQLGMRFRGRPIPLLNLDPIDYPFGLRPREIAGDPG